jgi:hypothetical protein
MESGLGRRLGKRIDHLILPSVLNSDFDIEASLDMPVTKRA